MLIEENTKIENRYCEICKKKLKLIGASNKNNKKSFYYDWTTRKYHKKCYKENEYYISNGLLHLLYS